MFDPKGPRIDPELADAVTEEASRWDLEEAPVAPPNTPRWLAVAAIATSLFVAALVLVAGILVAITRPADTPTGPVRLGQILVPPEAPPVAATPTPPVRPPDPDDGDPDKLVARGWGVVGKDAAAGLDLFGRALLANPDHAEAHYGMGYALLQIGQGGEAAPHLCTAKTTLTDRDSLRDVGVLLSRNGLSCPPAAH